MTSSRETSYRLNLVLGVLCLGLAAACVLLLLREEPMAAPVDRALYDPEVRRQAVERLVGSGQDIFDSFPDATVGRILQPKLRQRPSRTPPILSNDLGLRERSFALPKPAGTTRVVLLGDSFVMGYGVKAEERFGVFLEEMLREQARGARGPIECLHFGVSSWNILAECAFLRRQLSLAQPDLVIQVVVHNDLDDNAGVRGVGTLSTSSPMRPERADALFVADSPEAAFGIAVHTWIAYGLDWESRSRFDTAGREIARLAKEVDEAGGRYLLLDFFTHLLHVAHPRLTAGLRPEQAVPFPSSIAEDLQYRVARDDAHWNRAGHELAARFLFEVIRTRGLLPSLEVAPLPVAQEVLDRLLPEAEAEVRAEPDEPAGRGRRKLTSVLDFAHVDSSTAAQVTGGVVEGGLVSPYASLILRSEGRSRLQVRGAGLGRQEIDGVTVAVFADDQPIGAIAPSGSSRFDLSFEVPAAIAAQSFISIRFQSDDYAYTLPDLRSCKVFRLDRVALEGGR